MDFAPYQSSPPEHTRVLSPATSPRASADHQRPGGGRPFSPALADHQNQHQHRSSPPPLQHPQPQRHWGGAGGIDIPSPSYYQNALEGGSGSGGAGFGGGGGGYFAGAGGGDGREGISQFDTSLGLRLDYEACAAYAAFPPLGAIILLILERKSDYVRFHAWQSSLVFTAVFVVHLLFSWSTVLSWLIFLGDLALIAWLVLKAYRDADTLDRYEVPIFGQLASRILDDE